MASPSIAPSQSWTYAGTAGENHLSSNDFYPLCVVSNGTGVSLAVCTDGGVAVQGATTHVMMVPPNSVMSFPNLQPLPNANVPGTDRTLSTNWDVQDGYQGTSLTMCSIIPEANATGTVTISFQ
jgi:hypothetical protein